MKTFVTKYFKNNIEFSGFVQAINWEDAERKTNQEIVGELIETIDEDTGEIINFENLN
jgi:hypothetical protein